MKIYLRYLTPKSPLSERGLSIASLEVASVNLSKFRINMLTNQLFDIQMNEKNIKTRSYDYQESLKTVSMETH